MKSRNRNYREEGWGEGRNLGGKRGREGNGLDMKTSTMWILKELLERENS
jgi:hypothetical protein